MLRRIAIGLILALLSSGCAMKANEGPELPDIVGDRDNGGRQWQAI